jgi:arylsulfatase A-like enzyme
MNKTLIILILAAAAALILWKTLVPQRFLPPIVLITLDTTRADHLSCYGHHRETSPHLDRLADDGQLFKNAVAVSSWTLPTHASLFTGLYPSTHGAHYSAEGNLTLSNAVEVGNQKLYSTFKANGLPESSVTLAEILRREGYATGGVGAGPWLKPIFGLAQGFDYFDSNVNSVVGRRADEVTALGIKFLERYGDRPFFLFLNYFDPHGPYNPPPMYIEPIVSRQEFMARSRDPQAKMEIDQILYDAEIRFMDEQIGGIIKALKEMGLYEDAWIIVMNDHGELFGEHGLKGHGSSLYEGTVRCPFIVKWPASWTPVPDPEARCQQVDLLPTVVERLGLKLETAFEGEPLGKISHPAVCELFKNQGAKGPRFDRSLKAIFAQQYKLIVSSKQGDPDAGLFDLVLDPGENLDLTSRETEIAERLRTLLDKWQKTLHKPLDPRKIDAVDPETLRQLEALGYGH